MIINCILQAWRMRECWTNANVHVKNAKVTKFYAWRS